MLTRILSFKEIYTEKEVRIAEIITRDDFPQKRFERIMRLLVNRASNRIKK